MWRSLFLLAVCFSFKAHQVFGAEKLVKDTTEEVASISADKEITVAQVKTESYETDTAASVLGTKHHPATPSSALFLYPMMGASMHTDGWRALVSNSFVAGLGVEAPLNTTVSLALEGNYGDYDLRYRQFATGVVSYHNFAIYSGSLLGKVYLIDGAIRPYVGAGMEASYFEAQHRSGFQSPFTRWIGSGVVNAGAEVELARNMAIGVRASYARPLVNVPQASEAIAKYPEGNVMAVPYLRFMAMLSVGL